mgnify:FL=1
MSMKKAIQAKDIPDRDVLKVVAHINDAHDRWACRYLGIGGLNTFGSYPILEVWPEKVMLAKCASLIRRGLIDGCACGCRGDFRITEKGRELLRSQA